MAATVQGDFEDGRSGSFSFDADFNFNVGTPVRPNSTSGLYLMNGATLSLQFLGTAFAFSAGISTIQTPCYANPPYAWAPVAQFVFPGTLTGENATYALCRYFSNPPWYGSPFTAFQLSVASNDTITGHIHFEYATWKGYKRTTNIPIPAASGGEIVAAWMNYYEAIPAGTPFTATLHAEAAISGDYLDVTYSGTMPYTEYFPSDPAVALPRGRQTVVAHALISNFRTPGNSTLSNATFGSEGWYLAYSGTQGAATLAVSDGGFDLQYSGTLAATSNAVATGCDIYAGAKTLIDIDGLASKLFTNAYNPYMLYVSNWDTGTRYPAGGLFPDGGPAALNFLKNAPAGAWSETGVDITKQQVVFGSSTVLNKPGVPILFARMENQYFLSEHLGLQGSSPDPLFFGDDICFSPTTLHHAASVTVDAFASITGWTGTNATLASSGGLQITATGTPGSATKTTYSTDFRNFRIVRVRMSCNGAAVGRVLAVSFNGSGTHTYSVTLTGTGATDYDVDVMLPASAVAGNTDITDSSYFTPAGQIFGPSAVTTITIGGLTSGDVVTVVSITLVRIGSTTKGWILPEAMPSNAWPFATSLDSGQGQGWHATNGTTLYPLYGRLVRSICDGRPTMDFHYAKRAASSGTNPDVQTLEHLSIDDFVTQVNAQVGVSVDTPLTEVTSPLLSAPGTNFYSGRLYASYLTLDAPGSRATWGQDFVSKALNCWPQFAKIGIVPGYKQSGGANYVLRWTKRLYGAIMGTLVGPNAASRSLTIAGGASPSEIVTSDANGFFLSAPRLPQTSVNTTPQETAQVGADIATTSDSARIYAWAGIYPHAAAGATGRGLSYAVTASGRHLRAYSDGSGHLWYGESPNVLPLTFADLDSGIIGSQPFVTPEPSTIEQKTYLLYTAPSGSGIFLVSSVNGGASWSSPVQVTATGTHGAFVITRHSTKHFFWVDGAAIKGVVWDGNGNVIIPVFTAVASGVDDDSLGADEFLGSSGEHRIGLLYRHSGAYQHVSSSDYTTFA